MHLTDEFQNIHSLQHTHTHGFTTVFCSFGNAVYSYIIVQTISFIWNIVPIAMHKTIRNYLLRLGNVYNITIIIQEPERCNRFLWNVPISYVLRFPPLCFARIFRHMCLKNVKAKKLSEKSAKHFPLRFLEGFFFFFFFGSMCFRIEFGVYSFQISIRKTQYFLFVAERKTVFRD